MENFKQIAEDCLAGKLSGTFVLRNGKVFNSKMHLSATTSHVYPYYIAGRYYSVAGNCYSRGLGESDNDIVNFIPGMKKEQIREAAIHYDDTFCTGGIRDSFIEGAEWADANQPNPWISVEDKLPEEHTDVIVTNGSNVAYCKKYGDGFYTNIGKCCNVTHWMPIPELPKEEKK